MDCPHCGGPIDGGRRKPIEHAYIDDRWHAIVVGDEIRRLTASQWRLLLLLRERFRRFVPLEFLAQWSAANPEDGGDIVTLRLMVMRVRAKLAGSPLGIATLHDVGYGLFPVEELKTSGYGKGRRFTTAVEPEVNLIGERHGRW